MNRFRVLRKPMLVVVRGEGGNAGDAADQGDVAEEAEEAEKAEWPADVSPDEGDGGPSLAWLALGGLGLGAAMAAGVSGGGGGGGGRGTGLPSTKLISEGPGASSTLMPFDPDARIPSSPGGTVVLGLQVIAPVTRPDGLPVTNDGTVLVRGLVPGARWWYRFEGDADWTPGSGDRIPAAVTKAAGGGGDGVRRVAVYQQDVAGLDSPAAGLPFALDQTPPVRPALRLKNDTGVDPSDGHTTDPTMVIDRRDPEATLQLSIDGRPFVDWAGDEVPKSAFDGLQGEVDVRARLVDAAGNVGPTLSLPVSLHVTPPPAPLLVLVTAPPLADAVLPV
ncbi:hypothetical protein [Mitsuaria sp. GD03876]|uniref:hypothetical protein n=1 Tax=Mitsuaria sp. GD03876 TaxID=2975399 RepID=UPI00244C3796|nr:hypothetical protein [Mitsuaria sp. GD03876]MDH0866211.1 hypothetical protein [Mitsuaria sp. GD03876]